MWWVADGNKPFLLKYASGREHALMGRDHFIA